MSALLADTEAYVSGLEAQDSANRVFVVGEFGFGKTTLLLRMFELLERKVTFPIYAPVTQFDDTAFTNEKIFISALLAPLLEDEDWPPGDNLRKLLRDTLAFALRAPVSSALLLDGLDEHPYLYRADGIATLMNCLCNFNSQIVLTLRKEFWDERAGDFRAAFDTATHHNKRRKVLYLEDWGQPQLERFIERCEGFRDFTNDSFAQFAGIIRSGDYLDHYGDIPRRPLFLTMLAEEAAENVGNLTNLAILYYNYFRRKIIRDQFKLVPNPKAGRPLVQPDKDLEQRVGTILDALTAIAGKTVMVVSDGAIGTLPCGAAPLGGGMIQSLGIFGGNALIGPYTLQLKTEFTETDIQQATDLDVGLLAANSLLIPTSPRKVQGINYRFAHKSFQEWFAARWLLTNTLPKHPHATPKGLGIFLTQMNKAGEKIP